MRALLVHSPAAGTQSQSVDPIVAALEDAGFEMGYCEFGRDDIAEATAEGVDLVVAAGGDGTVAAVASEIADRHIPILIMPMGGSNNIARSLGIHQRWQNLLDSVGSGRERRLDIAIAEGPFGHRLFVEAVGLGAFNDAIHQVDSDPDTPEEKRDNGRQAYCEMLGRIEPFDCRVEVDGKQMDGPWIQVEAMSISTIGPRMPLAPRAESGDGAFDVILVRPSERQAMVEWTEDFCGPPPVRVERGRHVRLEGEGGSIRLDDRFVDLPPGPWQVMLSIDPQPATVLIPPQADPSDRQEVTE